MFEAKAYGRGFADFYDDIYPAAPDIPDAVRTIARLAEGGPVLELGVGTGRLAIPLSQAGVTVHGLDISPEMLDALAAKGSAVVGIEGDMTDFSLDERYSVVVIYADSLLALPSALLQRRCLQRSVAHLRQNGSLLVDTTWPRKIPEAANGAPVAASAPTADRLLLTSSFSQHLSQSMLYTHITVGEGGVQTIREPFRYVWPSELDLMAELAGAELADRYSSWDEKALGLDPTRIISRYVPAGGGQ